ncbi:MAG: Na+/H+ antiporter subunit E [Chloroflexota bacterium]|nr:Na+/H+ antiporter subunit E [Chloroflexota bacterium]
MKVSLLFVLALTLVWSLVMGEFSVGQALLGFAFGSLFVVITGAGKERSIPLTELPRRLFYLAVYLLVLVPYDVVGSNLGLARRLLRREPAIRPGIVRVRLGEVTPATRALEEHAITMAPGQMVVDYSTDSNTMYIHLIDVTDVEKKGGSLWGIYRRVLQRIFS